MFRTSRDIAVNLVAAVMFTIAVAAWAIIQKYWSWPNAIVGAVLLASALFYLMDRFELGRSLKSRVRDWLDSSGYAITKVDDTNVIHYRVTDNIKMITDVLQFKGDSPIHIATGHHLASAAQLATYNAMPPDKQQVFWRNVRLELLRYGIQFSDLKLDAEGVTFSEDVVPSRTLTATDFLQRLMFVRSAGRLYWELLIALNPPAPPSPPPTSPASAPLEPSGAGQK
jgi:hypothetical protein